MIEALAQTVFGALEDLSPLEELQGEKNLQLVYPLAWAYVSEGSGREGDEGTLQTIRSLGDRAFGLEDVGRRVPYAYCRAYELIREALGEDAPAWETGLKKMIETNTLPALRARENLTVLSSANVGYGTNHLIYEVAVLSAYAGLFNNEELIRYGREWLQRVVDAMHPDGYWAESDGPATSYNMLSGHCMYTAALDLGVLEEHRDRISRVAWFNTVSTFPNLDLISVTNGRSQFRRGCARPDYLGMHPEGVPLQKAAIEEYVSGRAPAKSQILVYLTDACRLIPQQKTAEKPYTWSGGDRTEVMSADFAFVRRRGWIAVVNNLDFRPRPEGHWNLDYTGLFSLYHDSFGTLFYGAHSKNDPAVSAFNKKFYSFDSKPLPDGKFMWKAIPGKGAFTVTDEGVDLRRDYRGFEGMISFAAESEERARIRLGINARLSDYPINAVLMPAIRYGGSFTDDTGREYRLGDEEFILNGKELGNSICLQPEEVPNRFEDKGRAGLRISFPDEAELRWPHAMWDPYNLDSDWYIDIKDNIILLVVPVGPDGAQLIIEKEN